MDGEALRAELVQLVWMEILATTPQNVGNVPAARRAIEEGAAVGDVVTAMRAAAYEMAFQLLYAIGSEHAPNAPGEHDRGWALVDFDLLEQPEGPRSAFTGVHEDLLTADPSGGDGSALWT